MAYQQVGTPRFYVNAFEWLASKGVIELDNLFRTLPVNPQVINFDGSANFIAPKIPATEPNILFNTNVENPVADSGVNTSFEYNGWVMRFRPEWGNGLCIFLLGLDNNGVPLSSHQGNGHGIGNQTEWDYYFAYDGLANGVSVGSIVYSSYYTLPHSPDLNLSLSYDYSGVKEITTRGGASLSNSFYSKSADWGSLGAWELKKPDVEDDPATEEEDETLTVAQANQKLSRSGRRVWDLSFSYLSQEDTFPKYNQLTTLETDDEPTDYTGETANSMVNILPSSDDFYSQVIHKTNGGQLPFIFQPNKDDNTNFAIAKIDSGFTFKQVANGVYNAKIRIKEVW